MARFIFPLQAVLELRRARERERQLALTDLERRRVELETSLRAAQGEITRAREELRRELAGRARIGDVRAHAAEAGSWETRAQRMAIELAGVLKRREGARAALEEAVRERRAIERLRERAREAWVRERERRERVELDELAIMRAQRREVSA